jgi:DnaJ-class molecular chaperone
MDPYRTLGVQRGCTREEVKVAFRTAVASAHPDHGGEDATFIQIHAAYELILAELDRHRRSGLDTNGPMRASRVSASTGPLEPTPDSSGAAHEQHAARRPNPAFARKAYVEWVRRTSAGADHRNSRRRRNTKPRPQRKMSSVVGATFVLYLTFSLPMALVSAAILEWMRSNPQPGVNMARLEIFGATVVLVAPLLVACWVVWKYE